jgi:hypothetical protein
MFPIRGAAVPTMAIASRLSPQCGQQRGWHGLVDSFRVLAPTPILIHGKSHRPKGALNNPMRCTRRSTDKSNNLVASMISLIAHSHRHATSHADKSRPPVRGLTVECQGWDIGVWINQTDFLVGIMLTLAIATFMFQNYLNCPIKYIVHCVVPIGSSNLTPISI